jgi:hypothetical protein
MGPGIDSSILMPARLRVPFFKLARMLQCTDDRRRIAHLRLRKSGGIS